jgi:L-amino acid N-acyltransferase YncA
MIVRTATPSDAQDMVSLLQEVVDAGGTTAIQGIVPTDYFDAIITGAGETTCCFVAIAPKDMIAGLQYVRHSANLPPNVGSIATFALLGATQRGIGAMLFKATLQEAASIGFIEIDATIHADNTSGLAYYSKLGFSDFEVSRDVPLADGKRVDRISKRLTL